MTLDLQLFFFSLCLVFTSLLDSRFQMFEDEHRLEGAGCGSARSTFLFCRQLSHQIILTQTPTILSLLSILCAVSLSGRLHLGDKSGFDTSRRLAASTDLCKQTSRPLRRQAASTDFTPKLRYFHENKQISPYFQPYLRVLEYYQSLFTPLLAIQLLPTRFEQLLSIFTHI